MVEIKKARKKRSDRQHAIYEICIAGQSYIGITAKTQSTILKSVKIRFAKHAERARNENKPWPLYKALKKHGAGNAQLFLIETIRGKAAAHRREVELIQLMNPTLNLARAKNK